MIDTHAHVHDKAFDEDREAMLARAREAGVETILTVGCDLADSERAMKLADRPGFGWTLGIHPHEAVDAPEDIAAAFDALITTAHEPPRAIGETGLDYYYDHSPHDAQIRVLEQQIDYARAHALPLIFHQRDAFDDFTGVLRAKRYDGMRGVVHCFTGDTVQAHILVNELGFYLGIGGVATFKNAEPLRDAIRSVGIAHLVLETDAPYLAPIPQRGKRNEPAFLAHTADRLAEFLACDRAELLRTTSTNARELFRL